MSDRTDESLMERYVAGDPASFDELFHRYEQRAFAYFMRRSQSEERAADLYQELFLRIHRFRDRYDPSRPFSPWFYQIAHNVLVDDFRRMARNRETVLEMDNISSLEPDAELALSGKQRARQLLDLIPVDQAAILIAAKVEGQDYAEIARNTGRSVDAVKQVASRALRRLRAAEILAT
jgi:RNA polymerase sigma-70 factor (ECF subfamily)